MGFDVTYHPITKEEINRWYFKRLPEVQGGDLSTTKIVANEQNFMEIFNMYDKRAPIENLSEHEKMVLYSDQALYNDKYINILLNAQDIDKELPFDITHGFNIAIVQGFFREYYYTRNSSLSMLIGKYPDCEKYQTPWRELFPEENISNAKNCFVENYSAGVYLTNKSIKELLEAYNTDFYTKEKLNNIFSHGRIDVLLEALNYAGDNGFDILEATDVMVPAPFNIGMGTCYSNITNCNLKGLVLFHDAAVEQINDIEIKRQEEAEAKKKKGFFKRLFGKD